MATVHRKVKELVNSGYVRQALDNNSWTASWSNEIMELLEDAIEAREVQGKRRG